ncbi:nucleic acid binding [Bonamia ostreae]|uniref:Nucleic acid binding n=1 Tax=Bonamia ostreae TaxID=126728 RepID=A0ABV2AUX9_9EUKA
MVVSDSRLKQFKMRRKPNALIDTMERVLPCPYCPKMFKRNAHVASHIRTHMLKKKMFKCSFCDATFSFMSGKRRHEKTHTGESIVHCEVCGKKFFRTHRLNIHRLKMHPEAIL